MTDTVTPLDQVRARFAQARDVEHPGPRTPEDGGGASGNGTALADLLSKAAQLPLNDFGNGQRIVLHFGRDLMFVPRVGWHVWDGTRWANDDDMMQVRRRAQSLAPLILQELDHVPKTAGQAAALRQLDEARADQARLDRLAPADRGEGHDDEVVQVGRRIARLKAKLDGYFKSQGKLMTHAKNAGNNGPLKHMLEEAEPTLAVPIDELDAAPFDVNCQSGLLRFEVERGTPDAPTWPLASVELVPHDRDQRQTKCLTVAYDDKARCPRFDAFLEEVQPDPDMRAFLQRWFGLAMTGAPVQRIAFFHGSGANGKSVMVDLVAKILGDYAATVRIESLTGTARRGGGDATPDLMPLIGARFLRTSEPDQGTKLAEGLIKELTGGEPIMVRALHSDFIEVRPIGKITMSGNHKPEIRGTDDGIWRRVLMVPWEVTIPEGRRDPDLVAKLYAEGPGILNWMVAGLIDYLERGLVPPAVVQAATSEYRAESDPLGRFLAECTACTGDETETTTTERLKAGFDHWLRENALPVWPGRSFSLSMAKKSDTWRHPDSGWTFSKGPSSKQAHYRGIRFTDDFRERLDAAPASGGRWQSRAPDPFDEQ